MEKCCNSCAVLACNKDKESPEGSENAWYAQANIDRLWRDGRQSGAFLICHSTDSYAGNYGGHAHIKPGHESVCLGYYQWLFMHLKVFEEIADYEKYCRAVGTEVALSKAAMTQAAYACLAGSYMRLPLPKYNREDRPLVYPTGFERTIELFNAILDEDNLPGS